MPSTDPCNTEPMGIEGNSIIQGSWRALEVQQKIVQTKVRAYKHEASGDFRIVAHVQAAYKLQCHDGEGSWKTVTCRAGDACLIPPGRAVSLRWELLQEEPMEHIHIRLPLEAFRRHLTENIVGREPDLYNLAQLSRPDPVITSAAVALVRAQKSGAGELYADCAAQYLVAHMLVPKTAEPKGPLSTRQIEIIQDFVRAHLAAPITLDDLASQLSLSRYHFLRLFKQTTGMTPHQYLTDQRMQMARFWLQTRPDSVGRIGQMCGYRTPAHFSRAFRKDVGVAPSQYRMRVRD